MFENNTKLKEELAEALEKLEKAKQEVRELKVDIEDSKDLLNSERLRIKKVEAVLGNSLGGITAAHLDLRTSTAEMAAERQNFESVTGVEFSDWISSYVDTEKKLIERAGLLDKREEGIRTREAVIEDSLRATEAAVRGEVAEDYAVKLHDYSKEVTAGYKEAATGYNKITSEAIKAMPTIAIPGLPAIPEIKVNQSSK